MHGEENVKKGTNKQGKFAFEQAKLIKLITAKETMWVYLLR